MFISVRKPVLNFHLVFFKTKLTTILDVCNRMDYLMYEWYCILYEW